MAAENTEPTEATLKLTYRIDGEPYDLILDRPFNMGESRILRQYTGLGPEDVDLADEEEFIAFLGNLDVIAAFMHIAYMRAHPNVKHAKIERLIAAEVPDDDSIDAEIIGAQIPLPSTTEPNEASTSSSVLNGDTSGDASESDTDALETHQSPITDGSSPLSVSELNPSVT